MYWDNWEEIVQFLEERFATRGDFRLIIATDGLCDRKNLLDTCEGGIPFETSYSMTSTTPYVGVCSPFNRDYLSMYVRVKNVMGTCWGLGLRLETTRGPHLPCESAPGYVPQPTVGSEAREIPSPNPFVRNLGVQRAQTG